MRVGEIREVKVWNVCIWRSSSKVFLDSSPLRQFWTLYSSVKSCCTQDTSLPNPISMLLPLHLRTPISFCSRPRLVKLLFHSQSSQVSLSNYLISNTHRRSSIPSRITRVQSQRRSLHRTLLSPVSVCVPPEPSHKPLSSLSEPHLESKVMTSSTEVSESILFGAQQEGETSRNKFVVRARALT